MAFPAPGRPPHGHGYAGAVTPGWCRAAKCAGHASTRGNWVQPFINGQRVLVDPSNRILRVFN